MVKRMSVVICGVAVMLMTAGVASAQTATQKTKTTAKKAGDATENAAKKTGAVLTDAEITTAVKTKFLASTKVSGLNISVDTTNHVVTLTGPVHSAAERAEALRLARTTSGVHKVVNKLTMEPKTKKK
jgi:hyperosmotically inducible protein